VSNNINKHYAIHKHYGHNGLQARPILLTCSLKVFGGNPFVNGSAIISVVVICSIDTRCFELLP
jgi:hypothetical protein